MSITAEFDHSPAEMCSINIRNAVWKRFATVHLSQKENPLGLTLLSVSLIIPGLLIVFIYIEKNKIILENTIHTFCISKCKYSNMMTRKKYSENNPLIG